MIRLKLFILFLVFILFGLQWRLWFGQNSLSELKQLKIKIAAQQLKNQQLREKNRRLNLQIEDLRNGTQVLEETARKDLGLIKEGETFFLYIPEEEK